MVTENCRNCLHSCRWWRFASDPDWRYGYCTILEKMVDREEKCDSYQKKSNYYIELVENND